MLRHVANDLNPSVLYPELSGHSSFSNQDAAAISASAFAQRFSPHSTFVPRATPLLPAFLAPRRSSRKVETLLVGHN